MCLNRGTCTICGCIISLTSPPWVPFFMCLLLLSTGRLGPSRAEVGVGFRCVRLVQALPSSPPSAGLVPCPSASAFLFPCPFRVCPLWARCVVLVFSLSLFFCVPLFASWLSNCHFIVIFISSAPLLRGVCVCVCTMWIDVKLLIAGGRWGTLSQRPTKTLQCSCVNVPAFYIHILSRPCARIRRSWGGLIFYRCCFIWSMSTVIIRLYITIYIYIFFYSSCQFIVGVFARPLHCTSRFAKIVLSKCVRHMVDKLNSKWYQTEASGYIAGVRHNNVQHQSCNCKGDNIRE